MANKSHPRRLGWDSFGAMGSPAAHLVRTAGGCTNRSRLLARSIALRRYGIVDIHPHRAGLDRYVGLDPEMFAVSSTIAAGMPWVC